MAFISATFVSDDIAPEDTSQTMTTPSGSPIAGVVFIDDIIDSIGGYYTGPEFAGLFRSTDIDEYGLGKFDVVSTYSIVPGNFVTDAIENFGTTTFNVYNNLPNLLSGTFVTDDIAVYYLQDLIILPLNVNAGGGTQTPKYYIG